MKRILNEEDKAYFRSVAEVYHAAGESVRETAERMGISRTKVRKILITLGEIQSDITDQALELMDAGYTQQGIADMLHISEATLSTYLPYGNRVLNREEKSKEAIRCENYRARQAAAASRQIGKREGSQVRTLPVIEDNIGLLDEEVRNMDHQSSERTEDKVMKLRLTLDTQYADMDILKKYGKAKEGITREILVSSHHTLHQLHYMIQKLFGWQNSHLHHYSFFDEDMEKIVQNSFKRYCRLCGMYFRFFYTDEDMEDIYWDDDYEEGESFKSWMRRKYQGIHPYKGMLEDYLIAQSTIRKYVDEDVPMRVNPSFEEWQKGNKEPRMVRFEDATYQEMYHDFECRLGELVERLELGEVLTLKMDEFSVKATMKKINEEMNSRAWTLDKDLKEFAHLMMMNFEVNEKREKLEKYRRRKNASMARIQEEEEKLGSMLCEYMERMVPLLAKTNTKVPPFTNQLNYEYDYGDGWEVKIDLVEEYTVCGDDVEGPVFCKDGVPVDDEKNGVLRDVLARTVPVCVAADGLPVLDDVGGKHGYCEFLNGIHGNGASHYDYNDPESSKEWARSLGWTGRMSKADRML